MSLLINGKLQGDWKEDQTNDGEYVRKDSQFRNWITRDGKPGPSGNGGFKAETGRYHLYVSYACPWAHRTLIFRKLKQLEELITVSVVHPFMGEDGWAFSPYPDATTDEINQKAFMHEVYTLAEPDYSGVVTVPLLWDKKTGSIVNNESSEIIRMFNTAFDEITGNSDDFYPEEQREAIDTINQQIYDRLNNGVYRCGFATSQKAYDRAVDSLFKMLDQLEERLTTQRYLVGQQITEADWRLLPTLLRFDPVYATHFKCNIRRLNDYPNLSNYMRDLFQQPGVADTFNLDHVKRHYYTSHESINPTQIIAKGFEVDYNLPHNREQIG